MELYAGMVNNMDYYYGRIEEFLKDIGEFKNTIVIFMSDNGPRLILEALR
jgi:arylsulfatase